MIFRSTSPELLFYLSPEDQTDWINFNPKELLSNEDTVFLVEGDDGALFEYDSPGRYFGHYFFKSRGKDAVVKAERLLEHFIQEHRPEIILGLTPIEHKGALWMNRRLGFEELGTVETTAGPHKLVMKRTNI